MSTCCGARRSGQVAEAQMPVTLECDVPATRSGAGEAATHEDQNRMVDLPAGAFLMGDDRDEGFTADGEGPVREVTLSAYRIDATAVTNAQFGALVYASFDGAATSPRIPAAVNDRYRPNPVGSAS